MKDLFNIIKKDNSLRYRFFYFCIALALLMIIISYVLIVTYESSNNYRLLLSAKELLLSSFGVFVIGLSAFYVLGDICKKFKNE